MRILSVSADSTWKGKATEGRWESLGTSCFENWRNFEFKSVELGCSIFSLLGLYGT